MKKWLVLFTSSVILFGLGCQPSAKSSQATSAEQALTYTCAGNEPFWSMQISAKEIVFNHMDLGKSVYPYRAPYVEGTTKIFSTTANGSSIKVIIETIPCEDSMSGATFPFMVTVERDRDTFRGCAETNLEGRKGGER